MTGWLQREAERQEAEEEYQREQAKTGGWQPIETAPGGDPDGIKLPLPPRILLWIADAGEDGKGRAAFGCVKVRNGCRSVHAEGYWGGWKITKWAPIPEGPPS